MTTRKNKQNNPLIIRKGKKLKIDRAKDKKNMTKFRESYFNAQTLYIQPSWKNSQNFGSYYLKAIRLESATLWYR